MTSPLKIDPLCRALASTLLRDETSSPARFDELAAKLQETINTYIATLRREQIENGARRRGRPMKPKFHHRSNKTQRCDWCAEPPKPMIRCKNKTRNFYQIRGGVDFSYQYRCHVHKNSEFQSEFLRRGMTEL